MAVVACRLEDISDMPNSKTNERLHEAKWLLHVALEQQTEHSASWRRAPFSKPPQLTTTANGDRSDTNALWQQVWSFVDQGCQVLIATKARAFPLASSNAPPDQ
jgi:hypothetical protein